MCIATFIIIMIHLKLENNPNILQLVNKLWYIYIIEYSSEIKTKLSTDRYRTWMNLKCIVLSERRQIQWLPAVWLYFMSYWKGKTIGRENRSVAASSQGCREGLTTKGWHKGCMGVLEVVFYFDCGRGYMIMHLLKLIGLYKIMLILL